MHKKLLDILACPECGKELELKDTKEYLDSNNIITGILKCLKCNKEYKIKRGIPRFVDTDSYVGSFSFEWKRHAKTQLDSYNKWNYSEREFKATWPFDLSEFKNKLVLDCGCGMGRFAEIALQYGAIVVGTDLSFAIDVAYNNLGGNINFHPVQCDIFKLPFKLEIFDYAYSLGVLHHTPDAKGAFFKIVPHIKKGGGFAINVYSEYDKIHIGFTKFYRKIVKFIGIRLFWYICYLLALLYYPSKLKFLRKIFLAVAPFRIGYNYAWTHLDTFDWYTPTYMSFHSHKEVDSWFFEAGLTDFRIVQGQVGFFGRKPLK
jgi:SAM-dependent methyltransferase